MGKLKNSKLDGQILIHAECLSLSDSEISRIEEICDMQLRRRAKTEKENKTLKRVSSESNLQRMTK